MPPKGKKKGKKAPSSPPENRLVLRRREQEKKADLKKSAFFLKKMKRERKLKRQMAASANSDEDNQESYQCEASGEEKKHEDFDMPHSSFTENNQSVTMDQKVALKKPSLKKSKKIDQPHFLCKESIVSQATRQQINPQNKSRKNDINPLKGKTLTKQKDLDINISKNVTESDDLSKDIEKAEQVRPQGIPMNYSGDPKTTKGKQRCQKEKKAEYREILGKEIMELSQALDSALSETKKFFPDENKKTKDMTKKRKKIKQSLKALETVAKTVEEIRMQNLPAVNEKKLAVSGYIKVSDKSVGNVDGIRSYYYHYIPENKSILMGDKTIRVSILVNDGSQVICNLRKLPEINFAQKVEPCSSALEGHATGRPDEDIKIHSKTIDQTTSETENASKSTIEFPNINCQTVDDQTTDNQRTDILRDSENREETSNDTKSNSGSVSNFSKENDSSMTTSFREKVRQICDDFLSDFKSACEKFETRIENQISDSLKSF